MQEAATALGIDIQTLCNWLSHTGGNQTYIDHQNPQQPVLNQAQVEQLAREHNLSPLVLQAYNNRVMQAGLPSTISPTVSNQVPQNNVPIASVLPQGNGRRSPEEITTAAVPLHHPMTHEYFLGNSAFSNTSALLFSTLTSGKA